MDIKAWPNLQTLEALAEDGRTTQRGLAGMLGIAREPLLTLLT